MRSGQTVAAPLLTMRLDGVTVHAERLDGETVAAPLLTMRLSAALAQLRALVLLNQ